MKSIYLAVAVLGLGGQNPLAAQVAQPREDEALAGQLAVALQTSPDKGDIGKLLSASGIAGFEVSVQEDGLAVINLHCGTQDTTDMDGRPETYEKKCAAGKIGAAELKAADLIIAPSPVKDWMEPGKIRSYSYALLNKKLLPPDLHSLPIEQLYSALIKAEVKTDETIFKMTLSAASRQVELTKFGEKVQQDIRRF
jgi:hypothetical protein